MKAFHIIVLLNLVGCGAVWIFLWATGDYKGRTFTAVVVLITSIVTSKLFIEFKELAQQGKSASIHLGQNQRKRFLSFLSILLNWNIQQKLKTSSVFHVFFVFVRKMCKRSISRIFLKFQLPISEQGHSWSRKQFYEGAGQKGMDDVQNYYNEGDILNSNTGSPFHWSRTKIVHNFGSHFRFFWFIFGSSIIHGNQFFQVFFWVWPENVCRTEKRAENVLEYDRSRIFI